MSSANASRASIRRKELYAVPKNSINGTLEASGYRADSALNASDLMELSKQLHGEYVLDGKVCEGTGNGVRLEARHPLRTGHADARPAASAGRRQGRRRRGEDGREVRSPRR